MPAEYMRFKRYDIIPCFLANKMCLLLLKNYQVVSFFKYLQKIFYKRKGAVFLTVLDISVNCFCGIIKN